MTSFEMHRNIERIDSYTGFRTEDPKWEFTDDKGHKHVWIDKDVPSCTVEIVDEWYCEEEADVFPVYGHVCRYCGETIEPGYYTDHTPRRIAGMVTYTIDGEYVVKEEYERRLREEYDKEQSNCSVASVVTT